MSKNPNPTPVSFFSDIPESIKDMEKEMVGEDKKQQEDNLQLVKERNKKAREIISKFTKPLETEIDDIIFMLKPISVSVWDAEEGNKEDPTAQSKIVYDSLVSPELSEEEFKLLPAGLKYKLFMFLLQDFFLIAGRVKLKNTS